MPALLVAAFAYLVVNLTLSRVAHRLERRVGRKSGGVVAIDPELQLAGPETMSDRALAAEARAQISGQDANPSER